MLMETVKAAEGRTDVDEGLMLELEGQPAPADLEITSPTAPIFGIPEADDPDPFGVLALEKEGLEIREAGTKSRPPSTQFDFNPSPSSPIYSKFHRRSIDTLGTRSNRESYMSNRSILTSTSMDRATQTVDFGTQTDAAETPGTSPSHSDENKRIVAEEPEDIDYTKIDLSPLSGFNHPHPYSHNQSQQDFDGTTVTESPREHDGSESHTADTSYATEDDEDEEEPVIFEAASAQATVIPTSAIKARGGLVNIPKRPPPPPLPPRSNARVLMVDQGSGRSPIRGPTKEGFEEVDLHGVDSAERKSGKREQAMGDLMEAAESMELGDKAEFADIDKAGDAEVIKDEVIEHEAEDGEGARNAHEALPEESEKFHSLPTTPLEVK